MSEFWIVTITHKTANINDLGLVLPELRSKENYHRRVSDMLPYEGVEELYFLNSCNRIMFLGFGDVVVNKVWAVELLKAFNPAIESDDLFKMLGHTDVYSGEDAIRHFFEVASSLESLVVGEREILRQVKQAYQASKEAKLTGDKIRLLLKKTIPTAKRVYTETKIGENPVSVVSLAFEELMSLEPDLEAEVLLLGAGQTNVLVGKFLNKHGFKSITVANRSAKGAKTLATRVSGDQCTLEELDQLRKRFSLIFCSVSASKPVVTKQWLDTFADDAGCTIVDLSVPNAVEKGITDGTNIHYIPIEKLRKQAKKNLAKRKREVKQARVIINECVEEFKWMFKQRNLENALSDIPIKVKAIKAKAFDEVFQKEIAQLDESSLGVLNKVVDYVEQKYIGVPIREAKKAMEKEFYKLFIESKN